MFDRATEGLMDNAAQVATTMAGYVEPADFVALLRDGGAEVQAYGRAIRQLTVKH